MAAEYSRLLSKGRIGTMDLRNRMVVSAMGVGLSEEDGTVGERMMAFLEEQAKGGAGMIVAGVLGVAWPVGAVTPNQSAISDDRYLPALSEMVKRAHRHGAKIAAQLHHGGLAAGYSAGAHDALLWGPSLPPPLKGDFVSYFLPEEMAAFAPKKRPVIKELEKADIDLAISQFAQGARRAKAAGFDGIEIHSAHGYLLSSFISPKTNSRTDDYGGPLENRIRLLLEVIAAIRAEVGRDFPLWCKLDAWEAGKEGGITLQDAIAAAKLVEAAGVDAITVSSYHNAAVGKLHSGSNIPHVPETNIPSATAIKAEVSIPVIASGRVELEAAERHIANGQYDFLAMGRKVLADPALPNKLANGQGDLIRPCVYCYTCVSAIYTQDPVRCAVNPQTGLEWQHKPHRISGQTYVVVGAGPGGMEAACQLAEAGNRVILLEKSGRMGGTLRFASLAYPANERLLDWLIARVKRSPVEVRLKTEVTPELLAALKPDAVIVATGARRDMPVLVGNDLPHVFSGDDMRNLLLAQSSDELKRKTGSLTRLATKVGAVTGLTDNLEFVRKVSHTWMPLGRKIVIIGGELVGVELAEFLCERGRDVTVIETGSHAGRGLTLVRRARLLSELQEHGVTLHNGASAIAIGKTSVTFGDKDGQAHTVAADHVIVAMGASGDTTVADRIAALGYRVLLAGDANGVGYIEGAIRGASDVVDELIA
ncbi:oxidoreductase [Brevundimonas sp.]|uniref:oxidoreductase n=1 Tax=Brevundimonas sp. TaxID=1871086 RepID=UPI002FCA036A